MVIDPHEIALSAEQKQQLAELADRAGKPWPEILSGALNAYRPSDGKRRFDSFYDAMHDVIGVVKDARSDLSTDPKHMEGFGVDHDPEY